MKGDQVTGTVTSPAGRRPRPAAAPRRSAMVFEVRPGRPGIVGHRVDGVPRGVVSRWLAARPAPRHRATPVAARMSGFVNADRPSGRARAVARKAVAVDGACRRSQPPRLRPGHRADTLRRSHRLVRSEEEGTAMRLRSPALVGVLVCCPLPARPSGRCRSSTSSACRALSTPQLSPDGRQVVYVQADADWKANKRISHLWRVRADGTATAQLTSAPTANRSRAGRPTASGSRSSPSAAAPRRAQIHLLPIDGGEAQPLTTHATAVQHPGVVARRPVALLHWPRTPRPPSRRRARRPRTTSTPSTRTSSSATCGGSTVATRAETRVTSGDFSVLDLRAVARRHAASRIIARRAPLLGDADAAKCG